MTERRWLALALPLFPVEVARRGQRPDEAGRPLALVERKGGSLIVRAASREALAQGVRAGSTHAQALAAAPDLVVRERREETERDALLALARWASFALAPRPSVDEARHALLVDVTGTELVHGSEPALLEHALARLAALGHEARGAIAATPLAALALADEGALRRKDPLVAPPGRTRAALEPLSPRALGLDPRTLETLAGLGIRTLGELLCLPRTTLPARFGPELPLALERALGERPHGLVPVRFPDEVRERLVLEGGTDRLEDLCLALEEVAGRALERVLAEGRAPRTLELAFDREGAPRAVFPLALAAPVSRKKPLVALLRDRLERLDLAHPVLALEVVVRDAGRRPERQGLLFSARDQGGDDADLAVLLARLEGRLGARNVLRARLVPDHRPERAFAYEPATAPRPKKARARPPAEPPAGPRPLRLLARPQRIDVALASDGSPGRVAISGRALAVVRAVGPERLETGFWDGHEVRRDYWVVADGEGRERWIYRELESEAWFLHGLYD